jgi:hypothetical protein
MRFTTESARARFASTVLYANVPPQPFLDLGKVLASRMRELTGGRLWMGAHMRRGDCECTVQYLMFSLAIVQYRFSDRPIARPNARNSPSGEVGVEHRHHDARPTDKIPPRRGPRDPRESGHPDGVRHRRRRAQPGAIRAGSTVAERPVPRRDGRKGPGGSGGDS